MREDVTWPRVFVGGPAHGTVRQVIEGRHFWKVSEEEAKPSLDSCAEELNPVEYKIVVHLYRAMHWKGGLSEQTYFVWHGMSDAEAEDEIRNLRGEEERD